MFELKEIDELKNAQEKGGERQAKGLKKLTAKRTGTDPGTGKKPSQRRVAVVVFLGSALVVALLGVVFGSLRSSKSVGESQKRPNASTNEGAERSLPQKAEKTQSHPPTVSGSRRGDRTKYVPVSSEAKDRRQGAPGLLGRHEPAARKAPPASARRKKGGAGDKAPQSRAGGSGIPPQVAVAPNGLPGNLSYEEAAEQIRAFD